jgi:hypothetical protein
VSTAWPVTGLFLTTTAAATAFVLIMLVHLAPHPKDIALVLAALVSKSLEPISIRRSFAVWRHHYRRGSWHLSRWARFYVVKIQSDSELLVAVDPWEPQRGAQIV